MIWEAHQIVRAEDRLEFAPNHLRVLRTEPKRHERADVSEHCVAYFGLQLIQVLVRKNEADAKLAQLRHHVCHGWSGEALEFVDKEMERPPSVLFCVAAPKRCKAERRHEECSKHVGEAFSHSSLRE